MNTKTALTIAGNSCSGGAVTNHVSSAGMNDARHPFDNCAKEVRLDG